MIEDILKVDKLFNEAMFLSKVNNIFVMLHNAIMLGNLDSVRHFLSKSLENYYDEIINDLNKQNKQQIYDELNVKSSMITKASVTDKEIIINVKLTSRYMDYIISKDTHKLLKGNNQRRIEKNYDLTLIKKIGAYYQNKFVKCPFCGADIDVNSNGKCTYCRKIFTAEDYDFILTNIRNS